MICFFPNTIFVQFATPTLWLFLGFCVSIKNYWKLRNWWKYFFENYFLLFVNFPPIFEYNLRSHCGAQLKLNIVGRKLWKICRCIYAAMLWMSFFLRSLSFLMLLLQFKTFLCMYAWILRPQPRSSQTLFGLLPPPLGEVNFKFLYILFDWGRWMAGAPAVLAESLKETLLFCEDSSRHFLYLQKEGNYRNI